MQPAPRTRRTPQNTQHTYSLDRRIHDVKTYPVQSPQGATVLLYGHENGITVVWRGGRRLKAPKQPNSERRNGAGSEDAVMIIDSDDESPAQTAAFVDKPEFEDSPTADGSSAPDIVQTLDLALGTAVLHIAVLPMPSCAAEDAAWNGAALLKTKMVFAVTCATSDVYVVTLPLTPPSHESKARPELRQSLLAGNAGKGVWGETLTRLTGPNRPCGGLAITLVKQQSGSRSRSLERASSQAASVSRAIVAAHSREASGTLRLWDVTLDAKPGTLNRVEPFQTEYLPAPLSSVAFNPTHLTQLLTNTSQHAVRIYDYATAALPSDDASEGPFPNQGSWLLSLYAPFSRGPAMSTARKPIVAAEWIAHGRAVLTLLADGQWGIWDIDGASPSAGGSGGLFSKAHAGLRGSAVTAFSVTGHLEGTSPLRNPATQKLPTASGSDFVPMTPHTRRDAITSAITGGPEKLAAVRGGIAVAQLTPQGAGPSEESAVLWLGGADPIVSVIPVVSRFWDSQLRRAAGGGVNLWSGAQPTRMLRLADLAIGLLGERCTGAAAVPKPTRSNTPSAANDSSSPPPAAKQDTATATEGLPIEVLLQGESRVVFVHESDDADTGSLTSRLLTAARKRPRDTTAGLGSTTRAIVAYPPPRGTTATMHLYPSIKQQPREKAAAAAAGGAFRRAPVRGLFDHGHDGAHDREQLTLPGRAPLASFDGLLLPSTAAAEEDILAPPSQQSQSQGLLFANDLALAADVPDDEFEVEGRDIEQELRDIMEIDRELEELERERVRGAGAGGVGGGSGGGVGGRKRVFFEEG